jgi:hypothetical protein
MRYFASALASAAWGIFCGTQDILISQGIGRSFIVGVPCVLIGSAVHCLAEATR